MHTKTHIIIGSSAAGLSAAVTLARLDKDARIICISDEIEFPYNKCLLVDYVVGHQTRAQLCTLKADLANNPNFSLLLGVAVIKIDPQAMSVTLSDQRIIAYDTLFLGMGASACKPSLQRYAGLFTFYTLADADTLVAWIAHTAARHAVVVGGGLNGLECANALAHKGVTVTLIERGSAVLFHHTDEAGAAHIAKAATAAGVTIKTCSELQEVTSEALVQEPYERRVTGVTLGDGSFIAADLVVFAIGMRPNSGLAQQAGILLHGQHVMVDNRLQTSISTIFAGGDLVAAPCAITGLLRPSVTWPDAALQGSIAAYGMMGQPRTYPGIVGHTVSHFFGLEFAGCGTFDRRSLTRTRVRVERPGVYRLFELEDAVLKAYSLIGETATAAMVCRRALLTKQVFAESELQLL